MNDPYQSAPGRPGRMPTPEWFAALLRGVDGPLGAILDVGSAEGVMSVLAREAGADSVLGIGLHDDRMAAALEATKGDPAIEIREQEARDFTGSFRTVVFSMMAHWLGPDETARYARMATRNFLIVFREANDHYAIPDNGTWFPTFEELDAVVGGVRTHEELLMTQDNDKRTWAAVYRTDLMVLEGMVHKGDRVEPFYQGVDLHGDPPFRPTHGATVLRLSGPNAEAVRKLARRVAEDALSDGTYPSDFSPRNVIVNGAQAHLIDDEPSEQKPGTVVAPEYLPIWRATLSSIGLDFNGDLRSLL